MLVGSPLKDIRHSFPQIPIRDPDFPLAPLGRSQDGEKKLAFSMEIKHGSFVWWIFLQQCYFIEGMSTLDMPKSARLPEASAAVGARNPRDGALWVRHGASS